MTQYSVWYDHQEQWDPDKIDSAAWQGQARSPTEAAEKLAEDCDGHYVDFIVRDDTIDTYRRISLVRGWTVKSVALTSLEDLRAP